MKIKLFILTLCFNFVFLWSAISIAQQVDTEKVDRIILANYPPLMNQGSVKKPGISVEIIREAAKRLGRDIELSYLPLRRAIKTLQHSSDAIQPALYRIPSREPHFQWIIKTHSLEHVFLSLDKPINTIEEARKLGSIGVEGGGALDMMLTELGFDNLERVDRPEINVNKLVSGRIEAWALSKTLAQWTWKQTNQKSSLVIGKAFKKEDVYMATGKAFPTEILINYRKTLEEMHADGSIVKIIDSYR